MRRLFGVAAVLSAFGVFAIDAAQTKTAPVPKFKSAELTSASEVPVPFNSVANGIVQLRVTIGESGAVEDVAVVRELASVTEVATNAVKSWKYSSGRAKGKPASTQLEVIIVFCPPGPFMGQLILQPQVSTERNDSPALFPTNPPEVTAGAYPQNPTLVGGTVVLEAVINADGGLDYVGVIRDFPGLTAPSLTSVNEKWKFKPALIDGKKVRSDMVIAFAFRPPVNN